MREGLNRTNYFSALSEIGILLQTLCRSGRGGVETRSPVRHLIADFAFLSVASIAANFRATCGPERRPPECSMQPSPAATPHVGQDTEDNCLGESSFIFIRIGCGDTGGNAVQI